MEAQHASGILGVIVLVWLLIGVVAAYQRDYFTGGENNCATAGTIALTVVAGPLELRGRQSQGGGLQRPAAQPVINWQLTIRRNGVAMIVLGAILLILGLVFGISILTYIGVVLLVIGAVFWILGSVGRPDRRQKSLVLDAYRPAGRGQRRDRHRPQDGARAGLGRLCCARLHAVRCGVQQPERRRAPSAGRRPRSASSSSCRSTSTQISTYCRCALRTCRFAGRGRWPRSRSWMRIRSDSPSAKSKWKSISPSSASAGSSARCDDGGSAGQQPGADADQQLDQQRLLVREVPVDRGPADAGGGADVLQPHRQEAALGDQPFGRGDQLAAAIRFRPAAARVVGVPAWTSGLPPAAGGHFG